MLSAAPLSDAARAQESPNVSEPTAAPAKAKSKKLIIIVAALAVLLVAGGAAAWLLLGKRGGGDEEEGHAPVAQAAAPKTPPTFLPMENMVVNLADPGGDRFAQVGITLELADAKTGELVKSFMPSIRSNVLLLVSQRSTEELLTREGKEKLAEQIAMSTAEAIGKAPKKSKKKRKKVEEEDDEEDADGEGGKAASKSNGFSGPITGVNFAQFIVQ